MWDEIIVITGLAFKVIAKILLEIFSIVLIHFSYFLAINTPTPPTLFIDAEE